MSPRQEGGGKDPNSPTTRNNSSVVIKFKKNSGCQLGVEVGGCCYLISIEFQFCKMKKFWGLRWWSSS